MFVCGRCDGTGTVGNSRCPICRGWGYLPGVHHSCTRCRGTGKNAYGLPCHHCGGRGWYPGTVNYVQPSVIRVPVETVLVTLLAARAVVEVPVSHFTAGVAAGLLSGFLQQRESEQLPEGAQLGKIFSEGGRLMITPDGVWHLVPGCVPARVLVFPVLNGK